MSRNMQFLFLVILIFAIIAFGPLALIWSINTLFPVVNIPYTFETWVAAALIPSLFRVSITKKG
jgi:hypothetical protein